MEILHIQDLSFSYPKSKSKALTHVSMTINEGDFVVICGESGSGKTTLLKLIKKELAPIGNKEGRILYNGTEIDKLEQRVSATDIGFVLQNPESQIVTDKVWHELAFGLENLGVPADIIRRRTAETASYFGIDDQYRQSTDSLSGGQKQLLNLASVMVMQPRILILDEPTSQLDPIASDEFIATLKKLNDELGITIILTEHRLESVFPITNKVAVMEKGRVISFDSPRKVGNQLKHNKISLGFPCAVRMFQGLDASGECPLTIKEGRDYLASSFSQSKGKSVAVTDTSFDETALEAKDLWFRYEKRSADILRGVSISLHKGEIYTTLGSTGVGKTTLLNVLSGINRAYKGGVKVFGKKLSQYKNNSLYKDNLALLPQNPAIVFTQDTVREDYAKLLKALGLANQEIDERIADISDKLGLSDLLDCHPSDLSGGEQQKCAIGKTLLSSPKILLLDEPTKSIDAYAKQELIGLLKGLKASGMAVLIVSHDIEFAAQISDKCALFFDGELIAQDEPHRFFSGNNYYTTAAYRISRGFFENAVLTDEIITLCKENYDD
ncbi:MAG: energy-coupling factor ABC transporter ATP-binding protein [Ruminococcus sp.]|nr:energy-coupling factor ABC transporter ATP-binding protein [Ruminococcus sp.]